MRVESATTGQIALHQPLDHSTVRLTKATGLDDRMQMAEYDFWDTRHQCMPGNIED
jgi:hypothetical protein